MRVRPEKGRYTDSHNCEGDRRSYVFPAQRLLWATQRLCRTFNLWRDGKGNGLGSPMKLGNIGADWNLDLNFERVFTFGVILRQASSDLTSLHSNYRVIAG